MRSSGQETFYLVGTSRAKVEQYEHKWLDLPWQKVRESVEVKLFAQDGEIDVLAKSEGRQAKEIAMRRKKLTRLLRKLRAMRRSCPKRDQLLLRVGAAKTEAGWAFGFVTIQLPPAGQEVARCAKGTNEVTRVVLAGCCRPSEAIRSVPNGASVAAGLHEAEAATDRSGAAAKVFTAGICGTGEAAARRGGRVRHRSSSLRKEPRCAFSGDPALYRTGPTCCGPGGMETGDPDHGADARAGCYRTRGWTKRN